MDDAIADSPQPAGYATSTSTRSGHQPGTPKPPFDPPRRRSSLHFSKAFSCSPPRGLDDTEPEDLPASPRKVDLGNLRTTTPSNTGRRRAPPSVDHAITPGHVTHMQRLFQFAKASLRMDMAFAASPTGSISSRLPPSKASPPESPEGSPSLQPDITKSWRYSTAPGIILGVDRDVREPVPGASPALPPIYSPGTDLDPTAEPISSGFNTPFGPVDNVIEDSAVEIDSSPPLATDLPAETMAELGGQLTALRVASDDGGDAIEMDLDDSPLVARVRRMSVEHALPEPDLRVSEDSFMSEPADGEIFLSEPAKAAAESAKVKRGVLRNFFAFRHSSKDQQAGGGYSAAIISPDEGETQQVETPCPDPALHAILARPTCPDPAAHTMSTSPALPAVTITPETAMSYVQGLPHMSGYSSHSPYPGMAQAAGVGQSRATATGSPMPFDKLKSPPPSPRLLSAPNRPSYTPPLRSYPLTHAPNSGNEPAMMGEHFQPGWYYTRESMQPTVRSSPMYSFSTAAAKSGGQSSAPDSRIRDSYRTDTLTPLARPPSRFRKTGMAAMASSRGVSKYYGEPGAPSNFPTRSGTKRPRHRSRVQFRSSPPPQHVDMIPNVQKRPRPRDLEDETHDDSQVMTLDDDTRAAIRMSLLGSKTPDVTGAPGILRELSPNVTTDRKPDRRLRKKRRPSYWDSDLKEVQQSPAGRTNDGRMIRGSIREGAERKVMTSPPKDYAESIKSEMVLIEGKENVPQPLVTDSMDLESDHGSIKEMVEGTMIQIEKDMD